MSIGLSDDKQLNGIILNMHNFDPLIREQMNEMGKHKRPFLFVMDFEQQKPLLFPLEDINPANLQFDFQGFSNCRPVKEKASPQISPNFISPEEYRRGFEVVQKGLQQGNSFLVNLTFPTPLTLATDLETIFHTTQAKYKLWLKDELVVFSPETFVQIKGGRIYSFPMKGTAPSYLPPQLLLDNPKEKAEHATIVDLIRNDLSQVAKKVQVDRYRYCEEIQTSRSSLWQTSSQISGELPDGYQNNLGDILLRLLPAGSISGAPKTSTVKIIQQAEGQSRGYYTGIAALWNGESLDSCVLIRCIEKNEKGYRYWSGGGITVNSHWEEEYKELKEKVYLPSKAAISTKTAS